MGGRKKKPTEKQKRSPSWMGLIEDRAVIVREVRAESRTNLLPPTNTHASANTHIQSTLAALNVACRRKFWNLSLGTRQAGSSRAARCREGEADRERGLMAGEKEEGGGWRGAVLLELPWLLSAYRQHEAMATLWPAVSHACNRWSRIYAC